MTQEVLIGNDNNVTLDGVKNGATNTFLNSATVTMTLKDSADANVSGESWPVTMAYVASSDGIYRGTLRDTLSLTHGAPYTLEMTVDAGADLLGLFQKPILALRRTT